MIVNYNTPNDLLAGKSDDDSGGSSDSNHSTLILDATCASQQIESH